MLDWIENLIISKSSESVFLLLLITWCLQVTWYLSLIHVINYLEIIWVCHWQILILAIWCSILSRFFSWRSQESLGDGNRFKLVDHFFLGCHWLFTIYLFRKPLLLIDEKLHHVHLILIKKLVHLLLIKSWYLYLVVPEFVSQATAKDFRLLWNQIWSRCHSVSNCNIALIYHFWNHLLKIGCVQIIHSVVPKWRTGLLIQLSNYL